MRGADPGQPIWVSYQLVALSAASSPQGSIDLEGSFEGVQTPIGDMNVGFSAIRMSVSKSAGTVPQLLEQAGRGRSASEWKAVMGPEMHAAYEALNAGTGRVLEATIVRTLPALGRDEGVLLVSVERAMGIRPLFVQITAGQGEVPPELKATAAAGGGSFLYSAGRIAGMLLFLWLLYRIFVKKRRE